MTNPSFLLFPEYKKKILKEVLNRYLILAESIVNYSNGNHLNQEKIDLIKEKLGDKMEGTFLYPGGASVLFGWSFEIESFGSIIIKPYYNRDFSQLLIHYLTALDFNKESQIRNFRNEKEIYHISIPLTIGLAKIMAYQRTYPTLITSTIKGANLTNYPQLIAKISIIVREFARNGIICDPYPTNWKLVKTKAQYLIYYIDLLSSNKLHDINTRLSAILNSQDSFDIRANFKM
ncbi:hypothetical protein [Candidatus Hodarchaeum mangrovi]